MGKKFAEPPPTREDYGRVMLAAIGIEEEADLGG